MKLVIEIDEKIYNNLVDEGESIIVGNFGSYRINLSKIIKNGTPIEEYCKNQWKERSLKCK